ncbi:MAG: phosphotransferase [Spirochaetales bacterium]|nr:phosphotransferase [Spirochaetales bacterium]
MPELTLIGKGMTAEIFSLENDRILKLYYPHFDEGMALHEARIAEAINGLGAAPQFHGIQKSGGRTGLVYERISGYELMANFKKPFAPLKKFIKNMAREQYRINSIAAPKKLISQRERLGDMIGLSKEQLGGYYEKVIARLEGLDSQAFLCHGDYHPGNIMVRGGEYIAIDWMNAYAGNPLSDAARTWLMFASPYLPEGIPAPLKILLKCLKPAMARVFRNEYLGLSGKRKGDFCQWIPVMAAARLVEQIPGEQQWLMSLVRGNL